MEEVCVSMRVRICGAHCRSGPISDVIENGFAFV